MINNTAKHPFKINNELTRCYGCRTCELACSFHHEGVFAPERASIKVTKCNRTGVISWQLAASCDGCANEDQPLCVKYCAYGALRTGGQV
jgi:anaerobic carbon-monoxide dehydrogenase iron sulfur subunit